MVKGLIAIAAGLAVCAGLGTGIGEGIAASKAVEAVGTPLRTDHTTGEIYCRSGREFPYQFQ